MTNNNNYTELCEVLGKRNEIINDTKKKLNEVHKTTELIIKSLQQKNNQILRDIPSQQYIYPFINDNLELNDLCNKAIKTMKAALDKFNEIIQKRCNDIKAIDEYIIKNNKEIEESTDRDKKEKILKKNSMLHIDKAKEKYNLYSILEIYLCINNTINCDFINKL